MAVALEGCAGSTYTYDNLSGGIMTSPMFPNNYPNNANCKWHFKAPLGKVVHLEFLSFNVASSKNCSNDSLTVYNGADGNANMSARLCGCEIPGDQISTDTNMFLHFVSNDNATLIGFKIRYSFNESKPWEGCDGYTHTYDNPAGGIMTSLIFPKNYPNNVDCKWHFEAPPGKLVHLEFLSFNVEPSRNCSNDSLTVYNGADEYGSMSAKLCGLEIPDDQFSRDTDMFLRFVSDSNETYIGFKIRYSFNDSKPWEGCGWHTHTYDNPSGGIMTSPMFPHNYPSNADCKWHFQAPLGMVVRLEFLSFNVESSNNCSNDSLTVYNGADANATMSARLCGHSLPKDQAFNETNMFLHFVSDSSRSYSGFQIRYRFNETKPWEGCNGVNHTYDNPAGGIMTSPLFPNNYPKNSYCKWQFQAPPGKVVHLEFLSFNVESDEYVKNCSHDALLIYDGYFPYDDILGQICGHSLPENQISSGRNMTVHFVSDSGLTYSGFKIRYSFNDSEAIALEGCEGFTHIYDNPSGGNMTSPMFPKNYPNNADCKWLFVAPAGNLMVYDGVEEDGVLLRTNYAATAYRHEKNPGLQQQTWLMAFCRSSAPTVSYSGFQIR
ncbi:PREDICTED: exoskeleton protein RP43-like [Priapulus caudatus]|uniref:Exoskeleton protein RP43-like n=1 Tax=Priapulus caudatus TaxID=37621 RepID=A0ABM1EY00_PRICU|nr:PREDICTED: exoskeleton protein RP43-like [Priapulus caudatus]